MSTTAVGGLYQGARPAARLESSSSPNAIALSRRFPPRALASDWPATVAPRAQLMARLLGEPFSVALACRHTERRRGLDWVLDWLELQPGDSWQDRWLASGADAEGNIAWRRLPTAALAATGRERADTEHGRLALARGMSLLVAGDVIRPSLGWLLTPAPPHPPSGPPCPRLPLSGRAPLALRRIAVIVAAKGGGVGDITVGDCLQLLRALDDQPAGRAARSPYFYQLLRAADELVKSSVCGVLLVDVGGCSELGLFGSVTQACCERVGPGGDADRVVGLAEG